MKGEGAKPVVEVLRAQKDAIVGEWVARTLRTYPEQTARFLGGEGDRFRNPVGHTLREALPALFDALVEGRDPAGMAPLLDGVVRIRAVQDFTAGQAVAFLFALKPILRETLQGASCSLRDNEGLAALEARIDEMILLAFDLFMQCRERMYQIRTDEARRRIFLLERMRRPEPSDPGRGIGIPREPDAGGDGRP